MHIHYNDIYPRPSVRSTALGVMKFIILVDPSMVIITIPSICLIYSWVKRKKILKEIYCIFTTIFIWPRPSTRIPAPGVI